VNARRDDQAQITLLLRQVRQALEEASQRHEIKPKPLAALLPLWSQSQNSTAQTQTASAVQSIGQLCQALQ